MNRGAHDGGYRDLSAAAAQVLELDEVVKDRTRSNVWIAAAVCFLLLSVGVITAYVSSSLTINCVGVTKQCQLDTTDHFGLRTQSQVLDMHAAQSPYWASARSGKTSYSWVEIKLSPHEGATKVEAGQGSDVAFLVLNQFCSFPDRDASGVHSLALQMPFVFGGLAACLALFGWLSWTVRVRITAVIEGQTLTLTIKRRLRSTRTLTFPLATLVGVEARRVPRPREEPRATIDVVLKHAREDLFPSPLPNGDQVDGLASQLHRFVHESLTT